MNIIARIHNDYTTKFGVPRQSGLAPQVVSRVVFETEYRASEALRGIEGWSHLWLIWRFHLTERGGWSPTVRPPKLGGNTRVGVFATRSPFRPNPIGLSCVRLLGVREEPGLGTVLLVGGADLSDGTPILDIKPYVPYADCHPEATEGFLPDTRRELLRVDCDPALLARVPEPSREGLLQSLAQDPRPAYQDDPERVYGLGFAGLNVRFTVSGGVARVKSIECAEEPAPNAHDGRKRS